MPAPVVLTCQHCHRKNYMPVQRGVTFADCPRCGRQTPTVPPVGDAANRIRPIDNPAAA